MNTGTRGKLISVGNVVQTLAQEQNFIEDRDELYKLANIIDNLISKI